jgi:4-carboxymuconolactone decarboxylase
MIDKRQAAIDLVSEMLSPEIAQAMANAETSPQFGAAIGSLALDNVFANLWTRPGLNRRDRSLLTLGILIALRATEELNFHIPAAIKNGLTKDEIAEIIYHSSGYAGFPAAASARSQAMRILDKPVVQD